ncbi:MAG: PIN domain-containing protein [Actinomycetes bacterium]
MTAFLDTNVIVRHLTGDPADQAARSTAVLASGETLLLTDLVLAECTYVLESFYEVPRQRVAELMRAAIALPNIQTVDQSALIRSLEIYEVDRLDFAEAYLAAQAEATGVGEILSFDRSIDRLTTVRRREP